MCEDARYLKYKESDSYVIVCEVPEDEAPKAAVVDGVELSGGDGESIKAEVE